MKKHVYSEQAVVRIWRNAKNFANLPTSHFGHAAVTVVGYSVKSSPDCNSHTQNISFWPGGGGAGLSNGHQLLPGTFNDFTKDDKVCEMNPLTALRLEVGMYQESGVTNPAEWDTLLAERNKGPLKMLPGQKPAFDAEGDRVMRYDRLRLKDGRTIDVPMYFQSPNTNIYLPGMMARGCHWGLNLTRMGDWWIHFKTTNPQYRALSTKENCVGVALQGLIEGGAASIVKPPEFKVYAEPVQLEDYAEKLQKRFLQLEGETRLLDAGIRSDHLAQTPPHKFELKDGLWVPDAWKRNSALGLMYSRSALISEIDRNLAAFHRLTWRNNFTARFDAFMNIFLGVCRHRHDKSESKRSEGVAMLGKQTLNILEKHGFWDNYVPA